MKNQIKLEEAAMFALSIYLFNQLDYAWWWFLALILTPDLGMLGYLINPKIGAISYNVFHHKGIAVIIMIAGWYFVFPWFILTGIILFGHASMDRFFGYGLKYPDSFKHTHLGQL